MSEHTYKTAAETTTIGIWKLCTKNGDTFYERDSQNKSTWTSWAKTHRLFPTSPNKRIVLLGESVARGYFYDPRYNVATELRDILKQWDILAHNEVIDLAKVGCGPEELLGLARSCLVLKPDMIVVFAGNNWQKLLTASLTDDDYQHLHHLA